jgi:hypothetical protein
MWVEFWDVKSKGYLKTKWHKIYIEAKNTVEAITIFQNKLKCNPLYSSCECCGKDFCISCNADIEQLTGYARHCRIATSDNNTNWKYLENDQPIPKNYSVSHIPDNYLTLNQYKKLPYILFISAN